MRSDPERSSPFAPRSSPLGSRGDLGLVIPAAGTGRRMGSRVHKPFLDLGGEPILLRTLRAFARFPGMVARVLVLHPDDIAWVARRWGDRLRALGVTATVRGGERRQDSVENGLAALPRAVKVVLVHDAVRPFVPREVIRRVADAARRTGAALAALPVVDTVKEVEDGRVARTLPRERIWLAQTPQGFLRTRLEEAFGRARGRSITATDECVLMEHLGVPVAVVEGHPGNLKITTPSDLREARARLR